MLSEPELSAVVDTITPVPLVGTFARRVPLAALLGMNAPVVPGVALQIVSPRFLFSPLSANRYNQPGVVSLYLGESEEVAAAEVKQHPGLAGFARKPSPPDTLFHIEVKLAAVLDLTDLGVQSALGTNLAELTAPWRLQSPHSPTQLLGAAVVAGARFEAIRYPCAPLQHAGESGVSLVIFRKSLWPGSTVKVHDPGGTWLEQWP